MSATKSEMPASSRPRRVRCLVPLLAILAAWAATARADDDPNPPPFIVQRYLADLPKQVTDLVAEHRALYLGATKTPEQASQLPALLWHMGDAVTRGGDLTAVFEPAFALGHNRDPAKLDALAKRVAELRPKAEDLAGRTHTLAQNVSVFIAGNLGFLSDRSLVEVRPKGVDDLDEQAEPLWLLKRAVEAMGPDAPDRRRAEAYFVELAGRLAHLADLDRWLALNCAWLEETARWAKTPGLAPRTLCYSIQCRYNEAATLQSRVEDILFATPAERAAWPWVVARAVDLKTAEAARPKELIDALPEMKKEIAKLREAEAALDAQVAALCHERKTAEAVSRRAKEYLPLAATLEYLAREAAIASWVATAPTRLTIADERPHVCRLSLAARAAAVNVTEPRDDRAPIECRGLLEDMFGDKYLSSYADLCFYQAAVIDTTEPLGVRLRRWAEIEKKPTMRGLVDMLHPSPGVMSTAQRADNSYEPRLIQWATGCRGKTAMDRFLEARGKVNAFYKEHGYNPDKPVYTMRDALDSGLIDCIAASRMFGAVAAAAGVEGIVPVRLWREKTGHSFVGLRTADGLMMLDPLNLAAPRKYPGGASGAVTIETGAPSFGSYVVDDVCILATGVRLRRDLPYLKDAPAGEE